MLSVLIITKNEELDLPGCLASVAWSDDVHVFDSFSTDRTVEIAREHGAHVHQRAFDSYAAQRNAGLLTVAYRYPWLLILDADERANPEMQRVLAARTAAAPAEVDAFRLRRRDHFLGQWLKHAQTTPFYIRVLRLGRTRFRREVNEVVEVDGSIVDIEDAYFDHYPFSKGLTHWVAKHNSYSSGEAKIVAASAYAGEVSWKKAFFAKDFNDKHAARKAIFYSLPGRPLMRWAYLMFYRRGILDGRAGFVYSTLQAFYEWLIVLKTRELQEAKGSKKQR
ncbi:glycosyltransferase family 2 protein [Acidipila sp. EB88]|uniref:glycosyltransferase family 2 protein n=1 Tax=Acidipila sp. EB88 TaxID=2305226 RepID=UPI000F5EA67D|nr:glycosyltransferase family 2 protein [Acidipila sp. EB88]RRA48803.1 glycosyltransferase family 2 protein [Acidipila sp. EB88]